MTLQAAVQWLRRRATRILCLGIAVGFCLFFLFVNPTSHYESYTLYLGGSQSNEATQRICPAGADAQVAFDPYRGAAPATFSIYAPSGATLWTVHASNGSTTFKVPQCGIYGFEVTPSESMDVVILLSWSAPFL